MNTTKKIFLILFPFLLLVLLISLVNAQEDFTASVKSSVELCPCSNQAYAINVQNTGSIASSYTVLAGNNVAKWVTFNPNRFVLNPGQKGSFFVFINSDCNIEGDYDLEVFITTTNGLTKVIKQVLKFSQCYDYSLVPGNVLDEANESIKFLQHDEFYSICKDEQKIIPILITNSENFENRYKLFLDAPEWAALNVDDVRLDAKKFGIFLINLDTTDIEGEFDFKLNAISELGKVQRKKSIEVNVEECYALEIDLEKEKDIICGGEDKSYEVIIKNSGTLRQNINLEVNGSDWVRFEEKVTQKKAKEDTLNASENRSTDFEIETISTLFTKKVLQLNPDEEKIVNLNVKPADNTSGNFEIIVHATPDNKTEFRSSAIMNVDVIEKLTCYKADISTKTSVSNFYNEDFFFAKVKNNGIKKAVYDVNLEGVAWVSVSPKTLELNPGQTGNLNLNVNPSENVEPGTYGIKIILESNDAEYSKNVDIILKQESESMKKLKEGINLYQYYIYLAILIIILLFIFRKKIYEIKGKAKRRYEQYSKVKRARLEALRLARKKREEEEEKKRELEEKKKEKARKKVVKKKFKISLKKIWIYVILLIAIGIFLGHQNKLFNAKYLHIYIKNFFIGYLYFILVGIGVVVVLFLLLLFYTYLNKRKKKRKVKKETRKIEKKVKKKIKWDKTLISVIVTLILIGLVSALAYFGVFEKIKDFFVLYIFYFILGIVILIIVILLIRFYKPLSKFFKE